jgi:RHS repeat-associated protein
VHDEWTYNEFGEVESYTANYRNGAVDTQLFSESIQRDLIGRVKEKTEIIRHPQAPMTSTTKTFTYQYDLVGRLMEVRDKTHNLLVSRYSYDANGNRKTHISVDGAIGTTPMVPGLVPGGVSATYDAADRLLQYGRFTYSWSPNGNLITKKLDTAVTQYSYDLLGNLTRVTLPDGQQVTYEIDGRNRRIAKLWNGVVTRRWLYQDGLRPIAELDPYNNVIRLFVYATNRNVPDYIISHGSTVRIITDQLGSPRLVVDVATGKIAQQLEYDEFGKIILDTNPHFQPFGFAGGLYDSDTGLVRFGARDYDPHVGRWTNKDPIGFAGGDTNLYNYVGSDPVNNTDVLGLLNPIKGLTAFMNLGNSVRLILAGGTKFVIGFVALETGVGVPVGLASAGMGVWNFMSSYTTLVRSVVLYNEAIDEDWSRASVKNLCGFLPYGQFADDPGEPRWDIFMVEKARKIDTIDKVFDFVGEIGSAGF